MKKLPPPLITLLSEQKPEIQYVALRNINLIVQKRPEILSKEVSLQGNSAVGSRHRGGPGRP